MDSKNEFLETIKFDTASAIEEYSRYLYDFKKAFYTQAYEEHYSISRLFPEVDFHTICRIKAFKSTMDKARNKGLDKVFDIHGIRHVITSLDGKTDEDLLIKYCYKLRDFLKNYYTRHGINLEADREKDYIVNPKENGYQALHVSGKAISGLGERKFETQIKTAQMDEYAKYGNANHAEKYKPRAIGKNPLASVPLYAVIRKVNGKPVMDELSIESCFQYFYNIPYSQYLRSIGQSEKDK